MLECCEIHQRIWVFLETFLRNSDELHNDSKNLAISLAIKRTEGLENSGSEEPLQSIHLPCFSVRARRRSLDDKISLMSMTIHAVGIGTCSQSMTIPSYLPSEMHLQKSLGISTLDREFPSWSLRKTEESRARIAVDQEIEATSSLKDIINPKSITKKDFSDCEELYLMMGAELKWCYDIAYLIHEISERSAVTRQKGRNTLTPSGRLKNVFSGRQLGLVQEETLVVFYTRMLRETVRTSWDEVERRKKISPRARVLFSTESEDTDWREKLEQSKGQSCD